MKINSCFKVSNMQTRVEMAGDRPDRGAVTLKLDGSMNLDQAEMLFSTKSAYKKILGHFWDKDGDLTVADVKDLPLTVEITGGSATISNGFNEKFEFDAVKVDAVRVTPLAGRTCDVTMRMSVYPDKDALWFLFQHQRLACDFTATPGQMSLTEGIDIQREAEAETEAPSQTVTDDDGDLPMFDVKTDAEAFSGMGVE